MEHDADARMQPAGLGAQFCTPGSGIVSRDWEIGLVPHSLDPALKLLSTIPAHYFGLNFNVNLVMYFVQTLIMFLEK